MEWVAISVTIARDPSVHRMAGALRVRVPEVVGLLALTFAEMSQHAPDGNVGDVPDSLLETWSGWHGKKGAYAAQFRGNLCNHAGLVLAWEKYNGANIRRAKAASQRARTWRERKENAHENADRTHTRTHTETVSVQTTVQDSTGQDRKAEAASAAKVPDAVIVLLDRLTTDQRSSWSAEIAVAQQGMHGPALTREQIQRAARDYVGNGNMTTPSLRHFRAYLRNAAALPPDPRSTIPPTRGGRVLAATEQILE